MTPEIKEQAIVMRSKGKTWKEIGDHFGISRQQFYWHHLADKQPNMVRKQITKEMISEATTLREQGLT